MKQLILRVYEIIGSYGLAVEIYVRFTIYLFVAVQLLVTYRNYVTSAFLVMLPLWVMVFPVGNFFLNRARDKKVDDLTKKVQELEEKRGELGDVF